LTPLNFLRRFPSRQVNLNLAEVFTIYDNLTELFKRRDRTIATLDRLAAVEAESAAKSDFSAQLDLRRAGRFRWQKRPYKWLDRSRQLDTARSNPRAQARSLERGAGEENSG
jgi:hypothetical protein